MFKFSTSTKSQAFIFFCATYLFSWVMFLLGIIFDFLPIVLVGIWGPSIVSLIMTYLLFGKKGISKLFSKFKHAKTIKWNFWIVLILLPAVIHFLGRSLWQIYYYGDILYFTIPINYWLQAIIPSFLIAGLGEELGWRGFALPRLQQHYSALTTSVIIAFFHLIWHLPAYWIGQGIHNVPSIYLVGFIFPWTVIIVWLYNKTNGNLVFAVGFHAISNASLSIVGFMPSETEVPITPELLTMVSLPTELSGPYLSVISIYIVSALLILKFGQFNNNISQEE